VCELGQQQEKLGAMLPSSWENKKKMAIIIIFQCKMTTRSSYLLFNLFCFSFFFLTGKTFGRPDANEAI
jgi:hypothetical protein